MTFDPLRCLLTLLVCAVALGIGLIVFQVFAAFYSKAVNGGRLKDMEEAHLNQQIARNAELWCLLNQIGAPDLASGHYSAGKMIMWQHFHQKKATHERLTALEHKAEIDVYYGHR